MAIKRVPDDKPCECCDGMLKRFDVYYDCVHRGPGYPRQIWGWICKYCFTNYTRGRLGKGIGQAYDSKTDEKVGG